MPRRTSGAARRQVHVCRCGFDHRSWHLDPVHRPGDQARAVLEGDIVLRPVHAGDRPVAKADQDVGDAPQEPGRKVRKADTGELRHLALATMVAMMPGSL